MKNYQIEGKDGKMYWVARSIATATFVFNLIGSTFYVLANKRGIGTPDFQGKWSCPCGYLDYDETLRECAIREVEEECSLKLDSDKLHHFEINEGLDTTKQNVTFRFYTILNHDINPDIAVGTTGEKDEVEEVKWINVKDIGDYEWAFDHDKVINKMMK